jgi:Ca2+-binding RTX toxin-like protein
MATIAISNAWGAGIDMSGYSSDGWGYMPADSLSGTLYEGYNTIIFDAFGYASFDAIGMNYYLYSDLNTVIIEDLYYFQGSSAVLTLDDINILTTISDLNASAWYVRFNQGADTFYGNDYVDIPKGGYGNDYLIGYGGNDYLYGDAGRDTLDGGAGSDKYYVDTALDLVIEASGQGTDTVYATTSYALNLSAAVDNRY